MAAREWDVPKPAYRWQQNRQKFLSDRLQIDAPPNEGEKAGSRDELHRFEWTEQRRDIARNIGIDTEFSPSFPTKRGDAQKIDSC